MAGRNPDLKSKYSDKNLHSYNRKFSVLFDQFVPDQAPPTRKQEGYKNHSTIVSNLARHVSEEDLGLFNNRGRRIMKIPEPWILSVQLDNEGQEDYLQTGAVPRFLKRRSSKVVAFSQFICTSKKNSTLKETASTAYNDLDPKIMKEFEKKNVPSFVKKMSETKKEAESFEKHQKKLRESFKIIKKLGQGKFGKVFLVKEIYTGMVLAMKVVQKQRLICQNLLEQFIRELKIHSYLEHPNIIKLYGFFHDQTNFYVVMECGCDGQLYRMMSQSKGFSEATSSFITRQMINAVSYMHGRRVLHRDIKPENIVMSHGLVKLCDLGWAVSMATKDDLRGTFCGTPLYLSPELLRGDKYDEKVDLWAIGVLAYQLMLNSSPFQIQSMQELNRIITKEVTYPLWKHVSKEFKEFMLLTLAKDPKLRIEAQELVDSQFIRKYSQIETCEELCY